MHSFEVPRLHTHVEIHVPIPETVSQQEIHVAVREARSAPGELQIWTSRPYHLARKVPTHLKPNWLWQILIGKQMHS